MAHIHDNIADQIVDKSEPSTSTQPFQPKTSLCNIMKPASGSVPLIKPDSSLKPATEQKERDTASRKTNTSINDLTTQCENVNINNDGGNETRNINETKRKNARKKEKLKKLQMPRVNSDSSPNIVQSAPVSVSVQELFMNKISPLYAATNSRYLENVSHHPHYQYMYGSLRDMTQNPNLTHHSVPNTPVQLVPRSPSYMQNAMQHPLLCKSFPVQAHDQSIKNQVNQHNLVHTLFPTLLASQTALSAVKVNRQSNSPKHRKKKNKDKQATTDDKKFEPYLSIEEVEEGLKSNILWEGVLRINPKQYQHSYVSSADRSEQDILIDGLKNRNRALEGDVVVVQLLSESDNVEDSEENKQKKGKVVYIKEKVHNRTCIGTLKLMPDNNRQRALFVPRDHRIPRLNIPCTCWPNDFYQKAKSYENTLFLARILDWSDTRFAIGNISCLIGQSGDMMTETIAILAQNDLDVTPYGPEVRGLYPRLDYTIPEKEMSLREDCRKLCLFSIDPYNCRDIDDAVSCRQLENGNYEIGVHISDVAHFLTENTILDAKVADKATTIYLVEKAYHMLPDDLCMLCSLFPGIDKLAFSVFWEITEEAQVINHRFAKTVIHSCSQLAYEHAQAILDDKENAHEDFPEICNGFQYEDVQKVIKTLGKIAAIFRKNRFEGGALRIDQPKVSFCLNPSNGLPESFSIYESKESHQLIEEFMLLANMTVANRIYEDHPKLAFLRCHPPPSAFMLRQLAKTLKPMGIDLDISSAGDLHRSLLPHVGPDNTDRGKAMVLSMLCAKPMTRAKYFCADNSEDEDFRHYALNVPLYTHFTSPIRRYADIMVHRLLAASLKYRDVPDWEVDKVRGIAAQCNKQKYNAKKAGEMSTEMYTLKYIEMNSPLKTEAVVVEIKDKYIDVIIVSVGLNRRIFFNNDFPGQYKCIKNEAGTKLSIMELIWNATENEPEFKQNIEVFSIIQVEMHKGDEMVKVETKLIRPSV